MIEPHHEAEELLPWYASGQLEGDDLALVEHHLASCAHCRRQLAFDRGMVGEFAAYTPEVDSGWARLRQRLQPPRRESLRDKIERQASLVWQGFNRPAFAVLAVAQLAFLFVAGAVLLSLARPSYRALGSAAAPQQANIIAMFDGDTSQSEMAALLRENGASLVGGPTPTDAYLLHVPASSRQAVLARLSANPHVTLAQPIDGDPS